MRIHELLSSIHDLIKGCWNCFQIFEDQGCDNVEIAEAISNPNGSQVALFDGPLSVFYDVEAIGKFPVRVKAEQMPLFVQVGFAHSKLGSAEKVAMDFKRQFIPEFRMPILDNVICHLFAHPLPPLVMTSFMNSPL